LTPLDGGGIVHFMSTAQPNQYWFTDTSRGGLFCAFA